MDEVVSAVVNAGLSGKWIAAALASLAWCAAAQAQLADPTRPPAALMAPRAGAQADGGAQAAPQVQSILIARHPGGRQVAVIDGQTVQLGGQFRGARVERMTGTEVVLVKGTQRQVLKLFPASASPGVKRQ